MKRQAKLFSKAKDSAHSSSVEGLRYKTRLIWKEAKIFMMVG